MIFHFKHAGLQRLYTDEEGADKYPSEVVRAFFDVMAIIASAKDIRDLYALKGLHFEKLRGKKASRGERSLRLNRQYRLIITIEKDKEGNFLLIIRIEDYH